MGIQAGLQKVAECEGLFPHLHSLSRSLKGGSTSLPVFATMPWVAVPRKMEGEWKFMERALLGWPKGTCHRGAREGKECLSPPNYLFLKRQRGSFCSDNVNTVKLVRWVAELILGACHSTDGEFGKLILNLSPQSSVTSAP